MFKVNFREVIHKTDKTKAEHAWRIVMETDGDDCYELLSPVIVCVTAIMIRL